MEWRAWYMADSASPADEPRIMAERRRYDLRAAIRAAGRAGERDHALLARLCHLARGGSPQQNEIEHAVAAFDAEAPEPPAAIGIGFTLTRLVAGEIDAIEFVEISPDRISLETLVVDDLGVPAPSPSSHRLSWPDILSMLPADEDLRRYQLAGGIGGIGGIGGGGGEAEVTADPVALTRSIEKAAEQKVRELLKAATAEIRRVKLGDRVADVPGSSWPSVRLDTVLVRRTAGWPLLEAATAGARAAMRPVAEIAHFGPETLADIVTETGCRAPLRYGYDLILAEIDPSTEEVKPARRQLFPPGTAIRPHHWPTENADVKAPPFAADQLVLPVVLRRGTDAVDWPPVGMATMPGSTPGITRLEVRLMAPGRVSFHGRPDVVSDDDRAPGWHELSAALSGSMSAGTEVDLVLLVELGGTTEAVASRVALATGVVGKLRDRTDVRIAAVGYRDHFHIHHAGAARAQDALIVGCGLERTSEARSVLARGDLWQAVEVRDYHAAPLEDALEWIAQPGLAWRPRARHLLVVLGRRPPHPSSVHDHADAGAAVCEHHLPWRDILERMRREHQVECVAVCHEGTAHGTADDNADRAWREIGAEEFFSFVKTSSADKLMHAIRLAADDNGSRLRLAVRADDRHTNTGEQAAHER